MARWLPFLLLTMVAACDSCQNKQAPAPRPKRVPNDECSTAADCADDNPCTESDCHDSKCVVLPSPAGTNCDNETVCDGVSSCDGKGKCITGAPPDVDDGNACTRDSCDATRGAVHEPVVVDDQDACTVDACDPQSGAVTHDPIDLDDGDDCTLDRCDRVSGPKHDKPSPKYVCGRCDEGFHTSSRAPSRQCGSESALQSFCMPDCGSSFYSCDPRCPSGYEQKSAAPNRQCGPDGTPMLFCMRSGR